MGIAEQDMMSTAAGLASAGQIPYASTFAVFAAGRAYDQIRNSICYPKMNVKICATHAGVTVGEDRSNTSNARRFKLNEDTSKYDSYVYIR